MTLGEHFREFRRRLFIAAASVLVAVDRGGHLLRPGLRVPVGAVQRLPAARTRRARSASTSVRPRRALSNLISLSIFVGVVAASPIWLYQFWAFIVPGLTRKEKRISLAFLGATIPLFLARLLPRVPHPAAVAGDPVRVQPRGDVEHPAGVDVLLLRHPLHPRVRPRLPLPRRARRAQRHRGHAGLAAHRAAGGSRSCFIFVFAAVATPTADPFTMFVFAAPLTVLYFAAYVRLPHARQAQGQGPARLARRRRHRGLPALTGAEPRGRDGRISPGRRAPGR